MVDRGLEVEPRPVPARWQLRADANEAFFASIPCLWDRRQCDMGSRACIQSSVRHSGLIPIRSPGDELASVYLSPLRPSIPTPPESRPADSSVRPRAPPPLEWSPQ